MIPTIRNPLAILVALTAATLAFLMVLTDASASGGVPPSLQRHLGSLTYLLLPVFFYLLMRGRRRRHSPSLLWARNRPRWLLRNRAVPDARSLRGEHAAPQVSS